jgi:hypothetical protein
MSLELRAGSHFLWLKHTPNQPILSELEEVCGKDVITLGAVENCTAAFDGGPPSLLICPGPGGLVTLERLMLSVC